jgi:hypothetical protein
MVPRPASAGWCLVQHARAPPRASLLLRVQHEPLLGSKRNKHISIYASEEDAARAYECAAVQAHGPDAKRNFPDEIISEPASSEPGKKKPRC